MSTGVYAPGRTGAAGGLGGFQNDVFCPVWAKFAASAAGSIPHAIGGLRLSVSRRKRIRGDNAERAGARCNSLAAASCAGSTFGTNWAVGALINSGLALTSARVQTPLPSAFINGAPAFGSKR